MKKALITLAALAAVTTSHAQVSQTEYNFLRLPASAHAAALGGDNISLVEDDGALVFHNPALLSSVSDKELTLSYMKFVGDIQQAHASFARAAGEKATWAVGALYMNYGKMKMTDADNNDLGTFTAHDLAVSGTLSYLLANRLAGGITSKMVFSYLGNYSSVGFAVDLGLNYYDEELDLSLSVACKNLGGELKAYNEEFGRMPIDLQVGASKRLGSAPIRLSLTFVDLNHGGYNWLDHAVVGAEFLLSETMWLGAGYNRQRQRSMTVGSDKEASARGAGLSFGGGLNLERLKLNLAWGKYHVSGSSLMFNLGWVM